MNGNKTEVKSTLVIPKGTVVKIQGIPFELNEDTLVTGTEINLDWALKEHPVIGANLPSE